MPTRGKISEFFALDEFERQKATVQAGIKEFIAQVEKVPAIRAQIEGTDKIKEQTNAITQLTKVNQDSTVVLTNNTKAQIDAEKAATAAAKAREANAKAELAETRAREANTKAAEREAAALQKAEAARVRAAGPINVASSTVADAPVDFAAIDARNAALAEQAILEAEAAGSMGVYAGAQEKATTATVVATEAVRFQDGALEANIELRRELQASIKATEAEEKNNIALLKTGAITQKEYNFRANESGAILSNYKTQLADVNKQIKTLSVSETANISVYKKLVLEYEAAALKAKEYNIQLGALDPRTQAATARAKQLSDQLKVLDSSVGQNQKKVGDYSGGIVQGFGKAFSLLRTIAYILPGIGIAGILGFISEGVISLVSNLFKSAKAFDALKAAAEDYKQVVKDLAVEQIKGSAGDVAKLELYRDILTDVTRTQHERKEALTAYNEIADKANKLDVDQLSNLNLINDSISRQITLIEKRALSRAAEAILGKKAEALLLARQDAAESAEKRQQNEEALTAKQLENVVKVSRTVRGFTIANSEAEDRAQREREINRKIESDEKVKAAQVDFDTSKKYLYSTIQLEGFTAGAVKDKRDKTIKQTQEDFKYLLGLAIKQQKDIVAAESGDNEIREAARLKQADLEIKLITGVAEFERKEKGKTKDQIAKIDHQEAEDRKNSISNALLDIRGFKDEQLKLADETSAALATKAEAEAARLKQAELDTLQAGFEAQMKTQDQNLKAGVKALTDFYAAGKINKEQYESDLLAIENKARMQSLQTQIDYYLKLAFYSGATAEEQTKYLEKVNDLQKQLDAIELADKKEQGDKLDKLNQKRSEKEIALRKKTNEALKDLGKELLGLATDLFSAGVEKQKNKVQDQIDALDKEKAKLIEVENARVQSTQERADAISIIEARAQVKKEALEQRQRELDQKKARFQKAQDIATIINSTAIAVVGALGSRPWSPANIVLAAVVGAIGAAQIARVIATPIPKYKDGTLYHPGGLAEVGDGGISEAIVTPDGRIYKTSNKSTTIDLPEGSVVHKDFNQFMLNNASKNVPEYSAVNHDQLTAHTMRKVGNDIVNAVKRIPATKVTGEGRFKHMTQRGHSFKTYLDNTL